MLIPQQQLKEEEQQQQALNIWNDLQLLIDASRLHLWKENEKARERHEQKAIEYLQTHAHTHICTYI